MFCDTTDSHPLLQIYCHDLFQSAIGLLRLSDASLAEMHPSSRLAPLPELMQTSLALCGFDVHDNVNG